MFACPCHILESAKWLKLNLVHTLMLIRGSLVDKNHYPTLSYLSLILFIKGGFLYHVLVYKWCWITSSAFYRHSSFCEHSLLPVKLVYVIVCTVHAARTLNNSVWTLLPNHQRGLNKAFNRILLKDSVCFIALLWRCCFFYEKVVLARRTKSQAPFRNQLLLIMQVIFM